MYSPIMRRGVITASCLLKGIMAILGVFRPSVLEGHRTSP